MQMCYNFSKQNFICLNSNSSLFIDNKAKCNFHRPPFCQFVSKRILPHVRLPRVVRDSYIKCRYFRSALQYRALVMLLPVVENYKQKSFRMSLNGTTSIFCFLKIGRLIQRVEMGSNDSFFQYESDGHIIHEKW